MAEKKTVDIILKGHDEASKVTEDLRGQFLKFGAVLGGVIGTADAFKISANAIKRGMEEARAEAALAQGDLRGFYEGQLKVTDAIRELGAAVPLLGEGIRKLIEAFDDRGMIEARIKDLETFQKQTDVARQAMEKWAAEAAKEKLKLTGATPSASG